MLEHLLTAQGFISLFTLVIMEIVLGIDNIIFISILCGKLPKQEQGKARSLGLTMALVMRILLLFGITWIISFKEPLFTVFGFSLSVKDLILLAGGLFLMAKSTIEIHEKIEDKEEKEAAERAKKMSLMAVVVQITLLDIVFSFDSILTAVGMVENNVLIMILAVIISMIVMLLFSGNVSDFINKHPTVKMLALSFLLMIGMMLCAESLHFEIPKGYIYFAMFFSLLVEFLNMRARKHKK
jgi:predicted tellurium resistance membrane protein TerC